MAADLVTPDDVASFWRPLTDAEQTVAASLIGVASRMIRRRIPDIDAQITAGTVDLQDVAYVISEMIRSAIEAGTRPVDAKTVSDTVGPYAHSVTYADAASNLTFTDAWAALLGTPTAVQIGSARLGLPLHRTRHHVGGDWCR